MIKCREKISLIKKNIGREATKRGYTLTTSLPGITTHYLAIYLRNENGKTRGRFDIVENLTTHEVELICAGERIGFIYSDICSFEEGINKLADYMTNKGYQKLDVSRFDDNDLKDFSNNYLMLANEYMLENNLGTSLNIEDVIRHTTEDMRLLVDECFILAKEKLMKLAAILLCAVLQENKDLSDFSRSDP